MVIKELFRRVKEIEEKRGLIYITVGIIVMAYIYVIISSSINLLLPYNTFFRVFIAFYNLALFLLLVYKHLYEFALRND